MQSRESHHDVELRPGVVQHHSEQAPATRGRRTAQVLAAELSTNCHLTTTWYGPRPTPVHERESPVGETPLTTRRVMPSEGYRSGRWSRGSCRGVSHGFRKYRHGKTIGTEKRPAQFAEPQVEQFRQAELSTQDERRQRLVSKLNAIHACVGTATS